MRRRRLVHGCRLTLPMVNRGTLIRAIVFFSLLLFCKNNVFAQLTEQVSVSATVVGEQIVVTPGGGGGSSGSIVIPKTSVRFSGQAYPNATVTLLKQGINKATVTASPVGDFTVTLEEKYDDNIVYSLFAEDVLGNRSLLINYPIVVQKGYLTHLSGIRFPPTITTDKSEVRVGDYLVVNGYALQDKDLEIVVKSDSVSSVFTLQSTKTGEYRMVVPLSSFSKGNYSVSVRYKNDVRTSTLIKFVIGNLNIFNTKTLSSIPGDCNADKIINLIDFSVLAFWYGKSNPPRCVDINRDNIINLVDFSILAFYWTG